MTVVKSMTGYGIAEQEINGRKLKIEIRTLNSKQMDLSLKIPTMYRAKEFEIRSLLTKGIGRGKTDVFVGYELLHDQSSSLIDETLFTEYFNQLKTVCTPLGIDVNSGTTLSSILRLPDVLKTSQNEVEESELNVLVSLTEQAINKLDEFRAQEGATLKADILKRIIHIEALKNEIIPFEKERIEIIKARIRENITAMEANVDNNRFEQELIYYIEKLDITEEKVRLQNHLDYFRSVMETEEAPGRKIGFICQEIGREINTTGSKANHSEMQRIVVEMKDELEKIKEQSLNIL